MADPRGSLWQIVGDRCDDDAQRSPFCPQMSAAAAFWIFAASWLGGGVVTVGQHVTYRTFKHSCDARRGVCMHIESMVVGSLLGAVAIVLKLTGRLQRSWIERDLHVGDLTALNNIAFRKGDGTASTQVERLRKRGFLANTARGSYRMTLTGWVAVLLRNTSARGVELGHQ